MSPLVSSGLGYEDYQRTSNYDTMVLWPFTGTVTSANVTSPLLTMSRFAYLGGSFAAQTSDYLVLITWFADKFEQIVLASRWFIVSPLIIHAAQIRIPNLGPYCSITLQHTGVDAGATVHVIGTNRVHPLEFIPQQPQLLVRTNVAIGANSAIDLYPSDYYAGPLVVSFVCSTVPSWVTLSSYDTTGTPQQYDILQATTAGVWARFTTVAPAGLWVAEVVNQAAGNAVFSLGVMHSNTGAL